MLDIGIQRFSSPFALMPKYSARIPNDIFRAEDSPEDTPFVFGEWVVQMQSRNAEWKGFQLPDRSNRYRNAEGQICYRTKAEDEVEGDKAEQQAPVNVEVTAE